MTNRELLEAAAKAAGWNAQNWRWESDGFSYRADDGLRFQWNPLTNDGDALRLAVRCQIDLSLHQYGDEPFVEASTPNSQAVEPVALEDFLATCAAYRHAIVKAAAQLGSKI